MINRKLKYMFACLGWLFFVLLLTSTDIIRVQVAVSNIINKGAQNDSVLDISVILQVLFRYGIYLGAIFAAAKLFYHRKETEKPYLLTWITVGVCLMGVFVYAVTVFYPLLTDYIPVAYWKNFFVWPNRWGNIQLLLYHFTRFAMYSVFVTGIPVLIDRAVRKRKNRGYVMYW